MATSSSSIRASIRSKENDIQACRDDIARLENKAEEQQETLNTFNLKADEYENSIDIKRRRAEHITQHISRSIIARKYAEQMDLVFSVFSWNQQKSKLISIADNMGNELAGTRADLDNAQSRLTQLNNDLIDLQRQYRNALQREAEEAAVII